MPLVDDDPLGTTEASTLPATPQSLIETVATSAQHEREALSYAGNDEFVSWWFAAPDTWMIDQAPGGVKRMPPASHDLDDAIQTLQHWLSSWTIGQANPFFHSELYRQRFPSHLQDAYLSLSLYNARTTTNKSTVFRILEDKVVQLVSARHHCSSKPTLDPLELLSYAQALLVHQVIGLFDGNIRLRHVAEKHILVLIEWIHDIVNRAQHQQPLGRFLLSSPHEAASMQWEKSAWYSWILAESIRRTWLMVSMVQGMYMTSRDGVDHCLGGMVFTSRAGFWEAPTASTWQQKCTEVYGGLIRLTEMNKLFANIDPTHLDEFAELVLKVTFNSEQLERWKTLQK